MAKVLPKLLIRIGSDPEGPYMEDLGVKKGSGMRFDITDKGMYKVLRLAAARTDKYSVPSLDMAEYRLIRCKFFWIGLLQFIDFLNPFLYLHRNPPSFTDFLSYQIF
jgi:hypothetical protein